MTGCSATTTWFAPPPSPQRPHNQGREAGPEHDVGGAAQGRRESFVHPRAQQLAPHRLAQGSDVLHQQEGGGGCRKKRRKGGVGSGKEGERAPAGAGYRGLASACSPHASQQRSYASPCMHSHLAGWGGT